MQLQLLCIRCYGKIEMLEALLGEAKHRPSEHRYEDTRIFTTKIIFAWVSSPSGHANSTTDTQLPSYLYVRHISHKHLGPQAAL